MWKIFLIETVTIPKAEYEALKQTIIDLKQLVFELHARVKSLEEDNRLLKNGHNSSTSSTPPSHDMRSSNKKSLREPSTRKTGGNRDMKDLL